MVLSVIIELFILSANESAHTSEYGSDDLFFGLLFREGEAKLSSDIFMDFVPIFLSAFTIFLRMAGLEFRELSLEEICFPFAIDDGMLELV